MAGEAPLQELSVIRAGLRVHVTERAPMLSPFQHHSGDGEGGDAAERAWAVPMLLTVSEVLSFLLCTCIISVSPGVHTSDALHVFVPTFATALIALAALLVTSHVNYIRCVVLITFKSCLLLPMALGCLALFHALSPDLFEAAGGSAAHWKVGLALYVLLVLTQLCNAVCGAVALVDGAARGHLGGAGRSAFRRALLAHSGLAMLIYVWADSDAAALVKAFDEALVMVASIALVALSLAALGAGMYAAGRKRTALWYVLSVEGLVASLPCMWLLAVVVAHRQWAVGVLFGIAGCTNNLIATRMVLKRLLWRRAVVVPGGP